jgi:hypothetical protein
MSNLFVIVAKSNVDTGSTEDYFIAEMARGKEVGTEQDAMDSAKELDKLYGKDYNYRVARLSFLD